MMLLSFTEHLHNNYIFVNYLLAALEWRGQAHLQSSYKYLHLVKICRKDSILIRSKIPFSLVMGLPGSLQKLYLLYVSEKHAVLISNNLTSSAQKWQECQSRFDVCHMER